MEIVIVISNILLAILTGFYVALTYRLVQETKKANDQNRQLFQRQFLLSTLPHLHLSVFRDVDESVITIHNTGNISAYDVDLLIVGIYNEDTIDVPTFMVKYVNPKYRETSLSANDEGFYGVYERIIYPIFPQKRKVVAPLSFLQMPDQILILLQFREVSGTNYSQVYWFTITSQKETGFYTLSSIDPNIVTPFPRVAFDKDGKLKAENGQPLAGHIIEYFEDFWNHSITAGYTLATWQGLEDRGEWKDV